MKRHLKKIGGPILAVSIGVFSQSSHAGCGDKVSTILQASSIMASFLPKYGDVSSAGLALSDLFICDDGDGSEELDVSKVVELIRTELDENTYAITELEVKGIASDMKNLAFEMEEIGDDQPGANFEELDDSSKSYLRGIIYPIIGRIDEVENQFNVVLTKPNNARFEYDMSLPIVMANYRLGLIAIYEALQGRDTLGSEYGEKINENFPGYLKESNRLRDVQVEIADTSKGDTIRYDVEIHRTGTVLYEDAAECTKNTSGCGYNGMKRAAEEMAFIEVTKMLHVLDLQEETLISLLLAKAKILEEGGYTSDFDYITLNEPDTRVMIKNGHPDAADMCVFMWAGGIDPLDESLENAATRLHKCRPYEGRQQFFFEDNGQIRSTVANLCLQAVDTDNKALFRECKDDEDTSVDLSDQQWLRKGDKLQVKFEGNTRCLSTRPGEAGANDESFRHVPCEDTKALQWFVYSPLENKELSGGVAPIASDSEDFGVITDPKLCAALGDDAPFYSDDRYVHLATCERYDVEQLWAQDGSGKLRLFTTPDMVIAGMTQGEPLITKSEENTGDGAIYEPDDSNEKGVAFLLKKGSGRYLFAESSQENAFLLSTEPPVDFSANTSGVFEDRVYWEHFDGGKKEW